MKLFLTSFLFLVMPLALATPVSKTPRPFAKLLYDEGFVIAQSINASRIDYFYKASDFTFWAINNDFRYAAKMNLKRDQIKESGGFVIEAFPLDENLNAIQEICKNNSADELKYLIVSCQENILLRRLTDEERGKIQKYRNDPRASAKPFVVKYTRTITEIQSNEINRIGFVYQIYSSNYHGFIFFANINPGEERRTEVNLYGQLETGSFALLGRKMGKGCITHTEEHPFIGLCIGDVEIGPYAIA